MIINYIIKKPNISAYNLEGEKSQFTTNNA